MVKRLYIVSSYHIMPPKKLGKKAEVEVSSPDPTESSSGETDSSGDEINVEEIIQAGKIMDDKYLLIVKIGYGNSANVWLAYDFKSKTYVAMKIQDYQCYEDGKREVNIIKKINKLAKANETYCVEMLECFIYEEEDDMTLKFICSVYKLYAGSIYLLLHDGIYKYGLPIATVKTMIKQTLTALAFLKEKVEVIHCDVKPENILFEGIPFSHKKVIETFEGFGFDKKYAKLSKKFASQTNKLRLELEILGENAVVGVNELNEAFENHRDEDSEEVDEEGLIEGEDGFDFDEDESVEVESESNDSESASESSSAVETIDMAGAYHYDPEEEKINTRRQSIGDIASIVKYKNKLDIESLYDFKSVLNNSKTSTDKEILIESKYVEKCKIALTDFGCSYYFSQKSPNEVQDRIYRSPEVIMNHNYGYAIDIWSVACVTFELLTGFPLFNPSDDPLTQDIHHLFLMEKIVGPIPPIIKAKSPRRKYLFDCTTKEYNIKGVEEIVPRSIKDILIEQHLFSKKDAAEVHDFLMSILVYNPAKRPTASDLLKHKWLAGK